MMSLLMFLCAVFSPLDVLDGIWDLIGSVSEGFPTYFCILHSEIFIIFAYFNLERVGRKTLRN